MTVARVVLIKLKPELVGRAGRAALAADIRGALEGEPGLSRLAVELPADADAERSWDLSVRLELPSLDAFERLAARERYKALFEVVVPERAVVVKAWSFSPA
ncbi:MAG: hypothetical protein KC668_01575 [Myxococcales bacterium]|nr:hypothetical protein [Myxococcales bacterium]